MLREFNHVHPQDDEEGKEFANVRVILFAAYCFFSREENFAFITIEMISYISFSSIFDFLKPFLFLPCEYAKNLLHLNVAACLLKLGEHKKSIEACNKVTIKLLAGRHKCRPCFSESN